MDRRKLLTLTTLVCAILLLAATPSIAARLQAVIRPPMRMGAGAAPMNMRMRRVTARQRRVAAGRLALKRLLKPPAALTQLIKPVSKSVLVTASALDPLGAPDYFGGIIPNYANSPLPEVDASGNVVPNTGIRKFVDSLPGLGAAAANDLGQYIPVATPNTTRYAGSDYYEIALVEYTEKLHADLPATKLRGYRETYPVATPPSYLGPTIVANRNRPVRIKFTNSLPTGSGGNLFLPVDKTIMGAGNGPDGSPYSENRATLHLHGGATPWISDGTPHQWTTPAGESTHYPKGVSVTNVPDMPAPGAGSLTFFYTNQQSARLMFYHDHAYGITRLNVYGGEAAPYLLNDPVEQELVNGNTSLPPLSRKIPLPVAPGTVPSTQIPLVIQDKTFVPNDTQLAAEDPTWDKPNWGGLGSLWFPHVYMPNQNPADESGANAMGRWDYGPWFWPPSTITHGPTLAGDPGTPNPSAVPEGFMDTPLVNGTPYPFVKVGRKAYRFRILNAANDRFLNLQLYYATSNTPDSIDATTGLPTLQTNSGEVPMVEATPHHGDPTWPANWPTDGRDGGVPDPTKAGPKMIQIGTEGGLLPAPVVLDNTPVGYEYNRRDITVLNVKYKTLFLGPAERADVIVDFSGVPAGSKLILYNDSPAPVPAFDPRNDYYTGDPDQTATGGAPTTLPGYGPNTRTIMQFQVDGTASPAFDLPALQTAVPAAFKASQDPIIVPQKAYGSPTNTFSRIQDSTMTFVQDGTTTTTTLVMQSKAIQELFELEYGRMNATLGLELPMTNIRNQTTLPFGFIDPPTEQIADSVKAGLVMLNDGTQIWKITHNGVDTHAIHFHLFNVQLVNRVGWDGAIKPPEPNELGWKETVRMNPLEDAIVALRPVTPTLPFKIGDSVRPLDPTQPLGGTAGFAAFDALGNPASVVNELVNYGWEYVWHCHLLGHEENDMMRPIVFRVSPSAPTTLTATPSTLSTSTPSVKLKWTNNAVLPAATMFTIQRATNSSFTSGVTTFTTGVVAQYTDTSVGLAKTYYYRVRAENTSSYSTWSNTVKVNSAGQLPLAPTGVNVVGATTTSTIAIAWTNPTGGAPPSNMRVQTSTNGTSWTTKATLSPTATSYTITGLVNNTTYWIRVAAVNNYGSSPSGFVLGVTQP